MNNWSVFSDTHMAHKNGDSAWITTLAFYKVSVDNLDLTSDWRFKEVPGNRMQLKYLGDCDTTFPIKYPLVLSNGVVINENDFNKLI